MIPLIIFVFPLLAIAVFTTGTIFAAGRDALVPKGYIGHDPALRLLAAAASIASIGFATAGWWGLYLLLSMMFHGTWFVPNG